MADPNKWRAKIKELQNQLIAAQIADDSVRAKKLKEDLRRVASVPFDSKIKQIENQRPPVSNQDRLPNAPVDRNAVRQDLLKREQEELNKAQGLDSEKPEDKFGGGPAVNALKTPPASQNKSNEPAKTPSAGQPFDKAEQEKTGAKGRPEASGPVNKDDSESDGGDESPQKGPNIRNAIANKAIDYAKKAALQAAKKIVLLFATHPEAWIVLAIILIIQIALFAAAMSFLGNKKVNTLTGGTFTQAADPIKDKDWITKVLALAGDKQIGEKMSITLLEGLRSDLTQLKNETADAEIKNKIETVIGDLNNVVANKTEDNAKKLIASLQNLFNLYENSLIPVFTAGPTRSPLESKIIRFNQGPFGKTLIYRDSIEGHDTYTQFKNDFCDAVDLYGSSNANVYPVFGGKVTSSESDQHGGWKIIIENNGYYALYANLKKEGAPAKDKTMTIQDKIGTLNEKSRIHLEVSYKGKCIATSVSDRLDFSSNSNKDWGTYLWNNIKTKLKINE